MTLSKRDKTKVKEYWLFWEYRGYMQYDVFDNKDKAIKRFKEENDGYQFPILIEGRRIL